MIEPNPTVIGTLFAILTGVYAPLYNTSNKLEDKIREFSKKISEAIDKDIIRISFGVAIKTTRQTFDLFEKIGIPKEEIMPKSLESLDELNSPEEFIDFKMIYHMPFTLDDEDKDDFLQAAYTISALELFEGDVKNFPDWILKTYLFGCLLVAFALLSYFIQIANYFVLFSGLCLPVILYGIFQRKKARMYERMIKDLEDALENLNILEIREILLNYVEGGQNG